LLFSEYTPKEDSPDPDEEAKFYGKRNFSFKSLSFPNKIPS